jgi:hypothetical protein
MSGTKIEITEEIRSTWNEYLDGLVTEGEYSAYGIHTVLNKVLVAGGVAMIRPQMMYNYARNGMIVRGEKIFGAALRPFTASEVREFVIRYCVRHNVQMIQIADPNQTVIDISSIM